MSLMRETVATAWIRVTDRVWDIFQDHRIEFLKMNREKVQAVVIDKAVVVEEYSTFSDRRMQTMGAHSYLMGRVFFASVGRYCSVAEGVISMGARHPMESVTTSNVTYVMLNAAIAARRDFLGDAKQISGPRIRTAPLPKLEHDVWIGNNVILKRGITLHTGCVVGAGSVVTKDVPPYAIVAGNPARLIRMRFGDALIARLVDSRWWEKHPKNVMSGSLDDPDRFLDEIAEADTYNYRSLTWHDLV